jgi:hypothetical protein
MKYEFVEWVRIVFQLLIALVFICGTALSPVAPMWADVAIRLCGAVIVFLVGFGVGFYKGKDGAEK